MAGFASASQSPAIIRQALHRIAVHRFPVCLPFIPIFLTKVHAMTDRIDIHGLKVARPLYDMIEREALPGTGIASDTFWMGLSSLVHEFGPRNRVLLDKRDGLQSMIDGWHKARRGQPHDAAAYTAFL
jgi:hypothetical protein